MTSGYSAPADGAVRCPLITPCADHSSWPVVVAEAAPEGSMERRVAVPL
jgi:hypothetical protein